MERRAELGATFDQEADDVLVASSDCFVNSGCAVSVLDSRIRAGLNQCSQCIWTCCRASCCNVQGGSALGICCTNIGSRGNKCAECPPRPAPSCSSVEQRSIVVILGIDICAHINQTLNDPRHPEPRLGSDHVQGSTAVVVPAVDVRPPSQEQASHLDCCFCFLLGGYVRPRPQPRRQVV